MGVLDHIVRGSVRQRTDSRATKQNHSDLSLTLKPPNPFSSRERAAMGTSLGAPGPAHCVQFPLLDELAERYAIPNLTVPPAGNAPLFRRK